MPNIVSMICAEYLCDIPCLLTWIIFNQPFDLFTITNFRSAETFEMKTATTEHIEPFTKSTISYGTMFISSIYHIVE